MDPSNKPSSKNQDSFLDQLQALERLAANYEDNDSNSVTASTGQEQDVNNMQQIVEPDSTTDFNTGLVAVECEGLDSGDQLDSFHDRETDCSGIQSSDDDRDSIANPEETETGQNRDNSENSTLLEPSVDILDTTDQSGLQALTERLDDVDTRLTQFVNQVTQQITSLSQAIETLAGMNTMTVPMTPAPAAGGSPVPATGGPSDFQPEGESDWERQRRELLARYGVDEEGGPAATSAPPEPSQPETTTAAESHSPLPPADSAANPTGNSPEPAPKSIDLNNYRSADVEKLKLELEEKLRKAEVEMSIQRAQLSQREASLEEKKAQLDRQEASLRQSLEFDSTIEEKPGMLRKLKQHLNMLNNRRGDEDKQD